jgi:hypothetical protein
VDTGSRNENASNKSSCHAHGMSVRPWATAKRSA